MIALGIIVRHELPDCVLKRCQFEEDHPAQTLLSVEPAARRAERNPGMSQKTENLNAPATTKPWRHSPEECQNPPIPSLAPEHPAQRPGAVAPSYYPPSGHAHRNRALAYRSLRDGSTTGPVR